MTRDEYARELKDLIYRMKQDNISLVLGSDAETDDQLDWVFTITDEDNYIYIG